MRILHLEASPGWGGQEIRILREAEGMRERGHEVFFAVMQGGRLIEEACKAGFTVYALNFHKIGWPLCLMQILKILRRHQIDIVNTHSSLDAWIGGIAARLGFRPIVRTRHLSTKIKGGLNSRLLYGSLADFVVTTCASILPMIAQQSGKCLEKCASIPTGVDPAKMNIVRSSMDFREQMGLRKSDFLVGTACFMRSWKGIGDFLKAADLLRHELEIKWVIIGGGHSEIYREQAKTLGLEGLVFFSGHLEDPFSALRALDVFALLSTAHEGVSQAILQAAFLEKPLIATNIGGLGEVCLDGKTGIQVAPYSSDQVARAVLLLKKDASLRLAMGRAGKKLVEEKFILDQTIDKMETVYNRLLSL